MCGISMMEWMLSDKITRISLVLYSMHSIKSGPPSTTVINTKNMEHIPMETWLRTVERV